jgi:hypothetical protein
MRETERGNGTYDGKKKIRGGKHVSSSQEICGWKKNAHG